MENGGERGIRTLGTLARSTVFETAPFNHSGTSPQNEMSWSRVEGYITKTGAPCKGQCGIFQHFDPALRRREPRSPHMCRAPWPQMAKTPWPDLPRAIDFALPIRIVALLRKRGTPLIVARGIPPSLSSTLKSFPFGSR